MITVASSAAIRIACRRKALCLASGSSSADPGQIARLSLANLDPEADKMASLTAAARPGSRHRNRCEHARCKERYASTTSLCIHHIIHRSIMARPSKAHLAPARYSRNSFKGPTIAGSDPERRPDLCAAVQSASARHGTSFCLGWSGTSRSCTDGTRNHPRIEHQPAWASRGTAARYSGGAFTDMTTDDDAEPPAVNQRQAASENPMQFAP